MPVSDCEHGITVGACCPICWPQTSDRRRPARALVSLMAKVSGQAIPADGKTLDAIAEFMRATPATDSRLSWYCSDIACGWKAQAPTTHPATWPECPSCRNITLRSTPLPPPASRRGADEAGVVCETCRGSGTALLTVERYNPVTEVRYTETAGWGACPDCHPGLEKVTRQLAERLAAKADKSNEAGADSAGESRREFDAAYPAIQKAGFDKGWRGIAWAAWQAARGK